MTARTYASGRFGVEVQLELHRPQCAAYQAAMTCITASRKAAALIARHMPPKDWPGETEEDRNRIWRTLAGRGLPTASAADLRALRGLLRDLQSTVATPEQNTASTDIDEVILIDHEDGEFGNRDRARWGRHSTDRSGPPSNRSGPCEPRRLVAEPPGELIKYLHAALEQAQLYRDTRHAMRLAAIGGKASARSTGSASGDFLGSPGYD